MIRLGLMLERSREDECSLGCPDGARRVLRVHEETVWYLGLPFTPRRAASCARFSPQILGSEDLRRLSFDAAPRVNLVELPPESPAEHRLDVDASGPHPLLGAVDLPGGVDKSDVAERLRKVA